MALTYQTFRAMCEFTLPSGERIKLSNATVIGRPGSSVEFETFPTHDQVGTNLEKVPTQYRTPGNFSVSVNDDPLSHDTAVLRTAQANGTILATKIYFPGFAKPFGSSFNCFVTEEAPGEFGTEGQATTEFTFEVTGDITIGLFS